ncbi:MAG TPA: rhodanese-like domain-containing protein [Anaerolineae bacterium]|nr:rhodanese-like domain-containing protein [Anaerolineae bacterium]
MSSWTSDPEVFVKRFNPDKHAHDYPIETEANAWGEETYDLPEPPGADPISAAAAWLGDGPNYITAEALYENLNDGDEDNDPLIISVRAKEDYDKGHIPGAIWASPKELFTEDMLSKIDPDRDIVVVCYTGQSAGWVAAGLNDLGYNANVLLFGMSSWTSDPEVFVKRFNPDKHAHDYPVEK